MANKSSYSKRFYYPTGLISLIFLPLLCIWYLDKHNAFKNDRTVGINCWNPSQHLDNLEGYPIESHPNKNYKYFNLTGNLNEDKLSLDKAQLEIRELVKSKDSTTGVHFHFSDKSKLWSLIRAIDICKIENANINTFYENNIWVYNPKPVNLKEEKPIMFVCEPILLDNCIVEIKSETEIEDAIKEKIKLIIETREMFFIPSLLFIAMIFLTIKRIYKN